MVLARDRIIVTLVSTYLALVATLTVGDVVVDFFQGNKFLFNQIFIPLKASPFAITAGLFVIFLVLLISKAAYSVEFDPRKPVLTFVELLGYSILSTGLILSSIMTFMPGELRDAITNSSQVASRVVQFHDWWIVLPVLLLLVSGFRMYSSTRARD